MEKAKISKEEIGRNREAETKESTRNNGKYREKRRKVKENIRV